jgi:hypothetical protein
VYRHSICTLACDHHLTKEMKELSPFIAHKKGGEHGVKPTIRM